MSDQPSAADVVSATDDALCDGAHSRSVGTGRDSDRPRRTLERCVESNVLAASIPAETEP